jgi:hypothetical protein
LPYQPKSFAWVAGIWTRVEVLERLAPEARNPGRIHVDEARSRMRLDPLDHDRRAHSGDVGRNVLLLAVGEQPLLDSRGRLGAEAACDLVCLRTRGKLDSPRRCSVRRARP